MQHGSSEWKQLIIDSAGELEISVSSSQADQFARHAVELEKWSGKMNLTAISDPVEVAIKHFVDSILPTGFLLPGQRLADIGSGGGFPGVPLKIMMPSLSVLMIDSSRKKISFLKHVVRLLKLDKIEARQTRLEDFALEKENCQAFDVVVCRAFSNLQSFVEKAIPLLAKKGMIIALKGKISAEELNSVQTISRKKPGTSEIIRYGFSTKVIPFTLPHIHAERSIIILKVKE